MSTDFRIFSSFHQKTLEIFSSRFPCVVTSQTQIAAIAMAPYVGDNVIRMFNQLIRLPTAFLCLLVNFELLFHASALKCSVDQKFSGLQVVL